MSDTESIEISIVVPVYKCRETLRELAERVEKSLTATEATYELIFVVDGCPDTPWDDIVELAHSYTFVRGLKLSRNFGQHEAITAGLNNAAGEWVVVMDCDLQDRPEEIPRLYQRAKQGFDIVYARRHARMDSWFKKAGSRLFYRLLGYLTDTRLDSTVGNFGIYHSKVIDSVLDMGEMLRYFPVMVRWVGFSSTGIDVEHNERQSGGTSYSLKRLMHLALNVMISFSDKPLRIIVKMGFWMSLLSAAYAFYIMMRWVLDDVSVQGWASLMVSLWFIGGLIMMMTGVVGIYVGKSFDESKRRPVYIIDTSTDKDG